ncbi:hypothetical protein LPJ59_001048 [Coemansia sp. RSA 2399]|nr:hypothetical protein LPJ59_001048 [Coemansia sp. RSA 2399]KAJ1907207.1 hypothetical protein LPJ81_000903 [Coemansia sp. IMI 209127]
MTRLPILRRNVETPKWAMTSPRIGIVYSAENWDHIEPLVNDLRYELTDHYGVSPVSIKITQAESVHDLPMYVAHSHQSSDVVFALGVVFRDAPLHQDRLVDLLTRRLGSIGMPGRLPVFDCILVKDSHKQLGADIASLSVGKVWARRAMDALAMLSRPVSR